MIFCDINTFYAPKSGGIRTYHEAKIAWFSAHPEHEYYLICPGPRHGIREVAPNVRIVEVFGPCLSRDRRGYRLMLDYGSVLRLLRRVRPDVVEAGDPWLTGLACLLFRRLRLFPGLLASFYHSDPIRTWAEPWAARSGRLAGMRRSIASAAARLFYRLQAAYPMTLVASRGVAESLRSQGVGQVAQTPFGTDPVFFSERRRVPRAPGAPVRILYAGRLGREKGMDLLLAVLPRLLEREDVEVTVAGRGSYAEAFAAISSPRYRCMGFVANRAELADVFRNHDILLAPGAHETFGLCVLEALATGLTVVGPDAGGTGEILGGLGSPFLFRADDVESFWDAIQRAVVANHQKASLDAQALARRYGTWDDAIGRMVRTYERAVLAPDTPTGRPAHASA